MENENAASRDMFGSLLEADRTGAQVRVTVQREAANDAHELVGRPTRYHLGRETREIVLLVEHDDGVGRECSIGFDDIVAIELA